MKEVLLLAGEMGRMGTVRTGCQVNYAIMTSD